VCFDIRYANIQKYDPYKLYLMMITHEIALDNLEYESRGCEYSGLKTTLILTSNSGWKYEKNTIPNLTESPKRIQCPSPEKSFIHINLGFFTLYFDLPLLWFGIPKKGKTFNSAKLKRRKMCVLCLLIHFLFFFIYQWAVWFKECLWFTISFVVFNL